MSQQNRITAVVQAIAAAIKAHVPRLLPAGGTTGQVLAKTSAADFVVTWSTPAASITAPGTTTAQGVAVYSNTTGTALGSVALTVTSGGAVQTTGTGAGATVGNARSATAVDLQVTRTAATQVASGPLAVISGGSNNTASASNATVSGGATNTASAFSATVGGGTSNTASGMTSTVAGGSSNTAFGTNSAVGGGSSNQANTTSGFIGGGTSNIVGGSNAAVLGGTYAYARRYAEYAHASGRFAATGDSQATELLIRRLTTDATLTALSTDGLSPAAGGTSAVAIQANSGVKFKGEILALTSAAGDSAAFDISGLITRGAGAPVLVASTVTAAGATAGAASWTVSIAADTTNNALLINVTGATGVTVRWTGVLRFVEGAF